MITLMKRIIDTTGRYKPRVIAAFVFAFLKAMLSKAPIMIAFVGLSDWFNGTLTQALCLWF